MATSAFLHFSGVQVVAAGTEIAVINGTPARRVKLMPMGTIAMRDGRGPYHIRDRSHAERIVVETRAWLGSADLMFDYDHQALYAPKPGVGGKAIAAGWVKPATLSAHPDGIYADVDWTTAAAAALAAREYRYVSPTFLATKDTGDVLRLSNAALVNIGAIDLPAIAAGLHVGGARGEASVIASAIGVSSDAGIDEIAAAIGKLDVHKLVARFGSLSDVERDVCRSLGTSEADFLAAKTVERIAAAIGDGRLDGSSGPLSEIERDLCRRFGMSEANFLAEKNAPSGR